MEKIQALAFDGWLMPDRLDQPAAPGPEAPLDQAWIDRQLSYTAIGRSILAERAAAAPAAFSADALDAETRRLLAMTETGRGDFDRSEGRI